MKLENIHIVDSELIRKQFAGTYIVEDSNEVALIEISSANSVNKVLRALENYNICRSQVKYLFVTHIHLDHSSGAGKLLKELPNAKLILQPSGAKHMVDPEKLIAGAIAVYGKDVVTRDYGEILPVPEDRVISCNDGEIFKLGTRELITLYTPGHARHHISIFDNKTKGLFTGDSLGLSYPDLTVNGRRFYQPTTTPTAFEYDKMIESIEKMLTLKPKLIFFTHFGVSDEPNEVAKQIKKRLKDYKNIVESLKTFDNKEIKSLESKLESYYIRESKLHGVQLKDDKIVEIFAIDIKLNAMGLLLWKQRGCISQG